MGQRPCVCNGENENCRYCFGSGYVPSGRALPTPGSRGGLVYEVRKRKRRANARPARTKAQGTLRTQAVTPKRAYLSCLNCGVTLRQDRFERHAARCPRRREAGSPSSSVRKNNIKRADQDKTSIPLETQGVHSSPGKLSPLNQRLWSNPNSLVACPYCGAKVKIKRIKRHHLRCPVIRKLPGTGRHRKKRLASSKALPTSSVQRGLPPTSREGRKERAYDQVSGRDRLDKTKDYAHRYRETGRFGSHPSHDGFDDESGPG